MNLTDEQKAIVSKWIAEGSSLSDVQSRLRSELQVIVTYMEARLLMAELNLTPVEKEVNEPVTVPDVSKEESLSSEGDLGEALPGEGSGVSVTIDHITKPGSMISGKVTFSDGVNSDWYLDQTGRLGLSPSTPGYRPSAEDVTAFQMELQRLASSQGF
ncbi:MAG: hypothetical protein ABI443_00395 [Chthoniobacterales bacterium]